jgi:hypothetical protein
MINACPACEFEADSHLLKLQRLQNRVLRTIGDLLRPRPTRALHPAFRIRFYNKNMQEAGRNKNHDNVNVRNTGKSESQH